MEFVTLAAVCRFGAFIAGVQEYIRTDITWPELAYRVECLTRELERYPGVERRSLVWGVLTDA